MNMNDMYVHFETKQVTIYESDENLVIKHYFRVKGNEKWIYAGTLQYSIHDDMELED